MRLFLTTIFILCSLALQAQNFSLLSTEINEAQPVFLNAEVQSQSSLYSQYYGRRRRNVDNKTFIDRRRFENKLGLELYTGYERANWNVSTTSTSPLMRRVERDAFNLFIARARIINLFGFQIGAEAKFTNPESLESMLNSRNLDLVLGEQGAEINTKTTRNLDFLHYFTKWGEKRNPNDWFNHVWLDHEFTQRQYNWNFRVPFYVNRDGAVITPPQTESVLFPGDVTENRFTVKFSIMEAFTPFADDIREEDYQRWNPAEEIIFAFFFPSVSVGWFSQNITSPYDLMVRESREGQFGTVDTRGVFIVDNRTSGFILKMNMTDPDLRLHRIRQPYLFNAYWNVLMGRGELSSAAFRSDTFSSLSHEYGVDFLMRPNSWFNLKAGYRYHVYNYDPQSNVFGDLEPRARFFQSYTFNNRTITAGGDQRLRYFRRDSFHALYLELTIHI